MKILKTLYFKIYNKWLLTTLYFLAITVSTCFTPRMSGAILNVASTNISFSLLNSFIKIRSTRRRWLAFDEETIKWISNEASLSPIFHLSKSGNCLRCLWKAAKLLYCFVTPELGLRFFVLCKVFCTEG